MKILPLATTFCITCLIGIGSAQAAPHHNHIHKRVVVQRQVVVKPAPVRTAVMHLTSAVITSLPIGHSRIVHAGNTYYYHDGVYYKRAAQGFIIVKPVIGIRVAELPRGYVTVRRGRESLYRVNDVYYRRDNGFYVVV